MRVARVRLPEGMPLLAPPVPAPRMKRATLSHSRFAWTLAGLLSMSGMARAGDQTPPVSPMPIDRVLQTLPADDPTQALRVASEKIGTGSIEFAGVPIDSALLREISAPADHEPLTRHIRETLGRPIDTEDFIYWLDDVIAARQAGRGDEVWSVPSGRARAAGLLLHPDDVFKNRPRVYGQRKSTLAVDPPTQPAQHLPAADGEPLGPRWTARFANPDSLEEQLLALHHALPASTFPSRVGSLFMQLQQQGAQCWITSTVRSRERGYLMWGAFILAQASDKEVPGLVKRLQDANESWNLHVAIEWDHPLGVPATLEAARQMADAYDVVYATEKGARFSSHYSGKAVDLVAVDLPRAFTLIAPDGEQRRFDLSDPTHARDLSLEPELIAWIEAHFLMRKLHSDYPHWTDTETR